VEFGNQVTES